jgi:hypothetical protein
MGNLDTHNDFPYGSKIGNIKISEKFNKKSKPIPFMHKFKKNLLKNIKPYAKRQVQKFYLDAIKSDVSLSCRVGFATLYPPYNYK